MGKRQASESLEELIAADSPASKRARVDEAETRNQSMATRPATDT